MTAKQVFIAVIAGLLLSLGGVFALHQAQAQQVCGRTGDAACPSGLICVSNRCNLPPPIWDARTLGAAQNARIFLRGRDVSNSLQVGDLQLGFGNQLNNLESCGTDAAPANCEVAINFAPLGSLRVGRGFAVYDGQTTAWLQVHRDGFIRIARGLSIGAPAEVAPAAAGELRAASGRFVGALSAETLAATSGTITGSLSVAGAPVVTRPAACAPDQYLRWTGSAWQCAAVGAGAETDPQFTAWRGTDPGAPRTLADLVVTGDLTVRGNVLLPIGGRVVDGVNLDNVITRPQPCAGGEYLRFTGTAWECAALTVGPAGVTDHGALSGLADNDHPQYYLQTGDSRDLSVGRNLTVGGIATAGSISAASGVIGGSFTVRGAEVLTEITAGPPGGLLITGAGNTRFISLQSTCADGQVLRWSASATPPRWQCATIAEAGPETDPSFAAWRAAGCLGPTFVGLTSATFNGGNNGSPGYFATDDQCAAQFSGSHVCSTSEILNSKSCDAPAFVAQTSGLGWVLNGPPAFPANANDCSGRTSALAEDFGSIWVFDAQGGQGLLTPCNTSRALSCCR